MTFVILKGISLFTSLRMTDAELAIGDLAVHGEVAYPEDEPEAVPAMVGDATDHKGAGRSHLGRRQGHGRLITARSVPCI